MQHTSVQSVQVSLAGIALALVAAQTPAQIGKINLRVDVQAKIATGNAGFLGCGFDGTDFYVTARAFPIVANGPHLLYRLDRQGNVLAVYNAPCPAYSATNPWGLRDLAFDGRYMYGGDESNIGYAFDTVTKTWDATKNITGPAGLTVMRALAYENSTDTFWSSNFGGLVYNFKRDGTIVWSGTSGATSMYGAAYDRVRNKFWWFGQGGSTRLNTGVVGIEFDPITKTPTGTEFLGDLSLGGTAPYVLGGIAGGVDFYYSATGEPTLLCLGQLNSDHIYEMPGTFAFGTSCAGGSMQVPEIGMQNDSPWLGNQNWQILVTGAAGATTGLLYLGTSKTSFSGIPLPFDLTPIGLPGCKINVALTYLIGTTPISGGFGSAGVPLPTDTSLMQAGTYWQWVLLDPTASNPLRMTTSTGGQTVLY